MTEKVLWEGRKSRKIFMHYYLAGIIFITLALTLFLGSLDQFLPFISDFSVYLSLFLAGIGVFLILLSEIKRIIIIYRVTETRVEKEQGIINKRVEHIPYQMVEKISSNNPWYARLLKIGDIEINTGEEHFWIKSIDNPEKVEEIIHNAISRITRRYSEPAGYQRYPQTKSPYRNTRQKPYKRR